MRRRGGISIFGFLVIVALLAMVPVSDVMPIIIIAWLGYKVGCWFKRKAQRYYDDQKAFNEWYRNRSQQ